MAPTIFFPISLWCVFPHSTFLGFAQMSFPRTATILKRTDGTLDYYRHKEIKESKRHDNLHNATNKPEERTMNVEQMQDPRGSIDVCALDRGLYACITRSVKVNSIKSRLECHESVTKLCGPQHGPKMK